MGNIHFRERRLFSLFSSTFVALLTVVLLFRQCFIINGELFTALSHWETLIRLENNFVNHLEEFVATNGDEFPRMTDLKRFLRKVKPRAFAAARDNDRFVSHPVNGFLIIKRFTSDWFEIEEIVKNGGVESELSKTIELHKPLFPEYDDLVGAVQGLFRLQEIYDLKARDIADGNLSENFPDATMETEDCFQVGLIAYHDKDFERAKEWMVEGLRKFQPTIYSGYLSRKILQEFVAWCEYEIFQRFKLPETGNTLKALTITNEILKEEPEYANAKNNAAFFQRTLKNKEFKPSAKKERPAYMDVYSSLCRGQNNMCDFHLLTDVNKYTRHECSGEDAPLKHALSTFVINPLVHIYPKEKIAANNRSCEEGMQTAEETAMLTCYYDHSTPQLAIKPAKIEVLNLEPRIVKYFNVITDEEIEVVKSLAAPRLRRATINNLQTGKLEYAKYRVSKTGWIEDYESEVIRDISKRISRLTGLDTSYEAAEEMQVANYGIGGHYEPHWDHAINPKASILKINKGNRIATFLIYMSDVESGGYTVFMKTNAIVKPSKGDAVFWYNLRRSGAGNSFTRHAACPVIIGSKWVSNKWIHSHGQEFRRPCGLNSDALPWETTVF